MKAQHRAVATWIILGLFLVGLVASHVRQWDPGLRTAFHFREFVVGMIRVFPCAFILIGLFEVWVKKETVQRHMGDGSGWRGYVWALLLAATTVGGLFVGFPIAYALHSKGARLATVFTYIGAAAICRVPMSLFEAFYLGGTFTLVRFAVSLPLLILSSMWLGHGLTQKHYRIMPGK